MNVTEQAFYRHVGQRIRAHRRRLDMTQERLAAKIGCSRPALANMEVGRQRIDAYRMGQLAHIFGIPADELIRGPIPESGPLTRRKPNLWQRLRRVVQP